MRFKALVYGMLLAFSPQLSAVYDDDDLDDVYMEIYEEFYGDWPDGWVAIEPNPILDARLYVAREIYEKKKYVRLMDEERSNLRQKYQSDSYLGKEINSVKQEIQTLEFIEDLLCRMMARYKEKQSTKE